MYLVKRNDGFYVAEAGSQSSYTKSIKRARRFPSREAAQRDCCGNEHVVSIYDELEIR